MAIRNVCYAILYVCHLLIRMHMWCMYQLWRGICLVSIHVIIYSSIYECFKATRDEMLNKVIFGYRRNQITLVIVTHWTLTIPNGFPNIILTYWTVYFVDCCMGKLCSSEYRCNAQQTYLQIYNFELMKMLVIRYSMRMRHETRAKIISIKKKIRDNTTNMNIPCSVELLCALKWMSSLVCTCIPQSSIPNDDWWNI